MEVTLDGERNFAIEGDPKDALAVMAAVNRYLRERGRAIMAVRVDGRDLSPQAVHAQLAGTDNAEIDELVVESKPIGALVNETLAELREHLPELPVACRSLAQIFQSEKPEQGFEPFVALADIWKNVKERQRLVVSALDLDLDELQVNGATLNRKSEELNGFLEEAVGALNAQDCVAIGDLLEYELAPRAEEEAAIVELLQSRAPLPSTSS